jgi:hypothetical protein
MTQLPKSASIGAVGLPIGDHWVRFHVERDKIAFEIAAPAPAGMEAESSALVSGQGPAPRPFIQRTFDTGPLPDVDFSRALQLADGPNEAAGCLRLEKSKFDCSQQPASR